MKNEFLGMKTIVETISALAIVISLVFVSVQMNENTKATRSAIAAETTATVSEWYASVSADPQLSYVVLHFLQDPRSLTQEEQYQAIMMIHSYMLILQSSFYLEEEGTLDEQIRNSLALTIPPTEGMIYYWEQRKPLFTNDRFIAFMEQSLSGELTHSEGLYGKQDE
jgi:hypothetical protein